MMRFIINREASWLILFLSLAVLGLHPAAFSAQIRLAWDPSEAPDLAGYEVYFGTSSWNFEKSNKLEKMTVFTLTDLTQGQTYCIALKAYNEAGEESGYSNQVCGVAHDESYGEWVLDITGRDKGGAVVRFDDIDHTFEGYGITNLLNMFVIGGNYTYDAKGTIHGTYEIHDFHDSQSILITGNLNGRLDYKRTTLTLQLSAFSMKGPIFLRDPYNPQYPEIPEDWTLAITGSAKGEMDSFKIEPYAVNGDPRSHLFRFSGSEGSTGSGPVDILGVLLLTPKDKLYGIYEIGGSLSDEGYLSGSFNGNLTQFTGKSVSDTRKRYTFTGQSKQ